MPLIIVIKLIAIILVSSFYIGLVSWFLLKVLSPWLKQHGGWRQLNSNQKFMVLAAYLLEFGPVIYLIQLIQMILR